MIELAQHESYWRGVDCLYVWEAGQAEPIRAVWPEGYELYGYAVLDAHRICLLSSGGWQVANFQTQTAWHSTGHVPGHGRGIVASHDGALVGFQSRIREGDAFACYLDLLMPNTVVQKRLGPFRDFDGPFAYGSRGLCIYTFQKSTITRLVFFEEDVVEGAERFRRLTRPDGVSAIMASSPKGTVVTDVMMQKSGTPLSAERPWQYRTQDRWLWQDGRHFLHVNVEPGRVNIWLRNVKGTVISPPLWHGVLSTDDGAHTHVASIGWMPNSRAFFLRYAHEAYEFQLPRLKRWPFARTAAEPEPLRIRRTFAMPAPDNPHEGVRRSAYFGFFPPAEVKT